MSEELVQAVSYKPATGGSSNRQGSQANSLQDRDELDSDEKSQYVFETVENEDEDLEDPYASHSKGIIDPEAPPGTNQIEEAVNSSKSKEKPEIEIEVAARSHARLPPRVGPDSKRMAQYADSLPSTKSQKFGGTASNTMGRNGSVVSGTDSLQPVLRNNGANLNETPPDSNYPGDQSLERSDPNMADLVDLDEIDPQVQFDHLTDLNAGTARLNEKNSTAKTNAVGGRLESNPATSARSCLPLVPESKPKPMAYNNLKAELDQQKLKNIEAGERAKKI